MNNFSIRPEDGLWVVYLNDCRVGGLPTIMEAKRLINLLRK